MHAMRFRVLFFAVFPVFVTPSAVLPQIQRGLVVENVPENSVAGKAGVRPGDRLLSYDERPLASPSTLQAALDNALGKDAIILSVRRGDETLTLTVGARLGIEVRPDLPPVVLTLYEEGRAAQAAKKTEEAVVRFTAAAKAAQEQLEMSKHNSWRSPYYWAAFGFQGEWR